MQAKKIDIEKEIVCLALISCFICFCAAEIAFLAQIKRGKLISGALIKFLQDAVSKSPNNPILNLLLRNQSAITENIEQSYLFNKIIIYSGALAITLCVIVSAYLSYKISQYKKTNTKKESSPSVKHNAVAFGFVFFATAAFIFLSILVPFLVAIPNNASVILCKGVDNIPHNNNALIEVLKNIINHTFQDEKIVVDFKRSVSRVLILCTCACSVFLIAFAAIGVQYYFSPDTQLDQSLAAPDQKQSSSAAYE